MNYNEFKEKKGVCIKIERHDDLDNIRIRI